MPDPHPLAELWRGDLRESVHVGHAVICGPDGEVLDAWGDPEAVIYPRSSCKMIQALPLVESGAADAFGLSEAQLALACASHEGAALHADAVGAWLGDLGLGEDDLLCGPEPPRDKALKFSLIREHAAPGQVHNNCSGKHAGFLTLAKHLGAGPDYVAPDHPVQQRVRAAFEDLTGVPSPGYGFDGCSAPNFATTMHGLARAMARFATADETDARDRAMRRLTCAMIDHPLLVAGEGRACTELMEATGTVAIKTGAEGVFVAILPDKGIGLAVKAADGARRAAECAVAALLIRLGVLDPDHAATRKRWNAPVRNRRAAEVGMLRPAPGFG
ncbi:L-asparaginase II [Tranquillimonas rosea]|uniref:L-asparaginase II n=1 Tax=Tranquillimonas rosea TaxID=641238 RepID=A0A1H9U7Z1_9RHOB|nr:asparaginase [Tranquillimonas rosea]SES05358.1 L-asparaginase II [Tranquillimonas rosea]